MKLVLLWLVGVAAIDIFPESNRKFSSALYKKLATSNEGDFVVCPLSLQLILGLLHVAAKGETARQLAEVLHLANNASETMETYRNVTPRIEKHTKGLVADIVNKLYLHEGFEIDPTFADVARDIFKSDLETVKFQDTDAVTALINGWVQEKTRNGIRNFVASSDIPPDARAILVNTVYLKGNWENAFTSVQKQRFYTNHSSYVELDMMEQKKTFTYYDNNKLNAKVLKMKYHQSKYALVIVLPNDQAGLSRLEDDMLETLREPSYINAQVQVRIPKFQASSAIHLVPHLQQMGVGEVFKSTAELTNMGSPPIHINQMAQRNYIDVNENGTTATSATRALARLGRPKKVQEKEFVADHPFVYYIRSSVGIVFVGRFTGAAHL